MGKDHTGFFWSLKERWKIVLLSNILKKKEKRKEEMVIGLWASSNLLVNCIYIDLEIWSVSRCSLGARVENDGAPLEPLDVEKQWLCNTGNHPRWKMVAELIRSLTDTVLAQTAPLRRSLGPQACEGKDGGGDFKGSDGEGKNGCLWISKNDLDASWSLLHPPRCNI